MVAATTRPASSRSSRMLARVSTRARTAVEAGERDERDQQRDGQHHQRDVARARDHPVIDLQHVERRGEIEQVDRQAEDQRGDEIAPAGVEDPAQLIGLRFCKHAQPRGSSPALFSPRPMEKPPAARELDAVGGGRRLEGGWGWPADGSLETRVPVGRVARSLAINQGSKFHRKPCRAIKKLATLK